MNRPDRTDRPPGCPGSVVLVEFAEALLAPEKREAVRLHLSGCVRCRREVADSEALTALLIARTETGSRPDDGCVHTALIERIEGAIRRIVTIPLEPVTEAGGAIRGSTVALRTGARGRSMVFEGGGWFVHVRVDASGGKGGGTLRGRIVGEKNAPADPGMRGFRVVLIDDRGVAGSTVPDRFGRFRFGPDRVRGPGPRTLKIWTSPDTELVVCLPAEAEAGEHPA